MRLCLLALAVALTGCASKSTDTTSDATQSTTDDVTDTDGATDETDPTDETTTDGGTIELTTRDGVALVADYYPAASEGRPAVVLLHMIPPGNDRTGWPIDFIEALNANDWSVIAVDRRGAGDSNGVAEDAYTGEWGRYDVEACAERLRADGAGALAIIGASNGTTSMIDYAVWAPGEGLPEVAALGFMTGGSYTETQTTMESLPGVPSAFTYSTAEAAWSVDQQPLDPGSWSFLEYASGDHGTRMFDAAPEVADDLETFLRDTLPGGE